MTEQDSLEIEEEAESPKEQARALQIRRCATMTAGEEQEYGVLLPVNYDDSSETKYPLIVLLHGRTGHYTDWFRLTRLERYSRQYNVIFVFPEGGNGWFTDAFDGSSPGESNLIQHLFPHLQETLPLLSPGKHWAIGGLSMGGFGAVKIALKYPRIFSTAVGHSGAYERPGCAEFHPVFGDPQQQLQMRRAENPFSLAELALCKWPTERPMLYLDCGLSDELLETNRRFAGHLNFIGYPHRYTEQPGHHTWPYWNRAFRAILPSVMERLGSPAI